MKTENVPDRSKIISITMAFSLSWIIRERCKKRSDMTETIVLISTFNRGFSISCHFYRSITLKVSGFLMFLGGLKKTSSMEWFYKDFRFYILLLYEKMQCNFNLQHLSLPFPNYKAQTKVRRFFINPSRSEPGKREFLFSLFFVVPQKVLWRSWKAFKVP